MCQEVVKNVSELNAFDEAQIPSVLHKLISPAHECNWFTCNGIESIMIVKQGTRAGKPLGDIIFVFLMCRV